MNTIKILVEGYAQVNPNGTRDATSTQLNTNKINVKIGQLEGWCNSSITVS